MFAADTQLNGEPSTWVLEGQRLLMLTKASEWFFRTMSGGRWTRCLRRALRWAHPSLDGIRELFDCVEVEPVGIQHVAHDNTDLWERSTATTCAVLYQVLCQLAEYFGWDMDEVHRYAGEINKWRPGVILDTT